MSIMESIAAGLGRRRSSSSSQGAANADVKADNAPVRKLKTVLEQKKLVVMDGGFGSELERRGLDVNHPLWSALVLAHQPDKVYELHRDYFAAGADVAITCTYQASVAGLMGHGISKSEDAALVLIGDAVELAKKARDVTKPHGIVAASVGPYGAYLANGAEYSGDYEDASNETLASFHSGRLNALCAAEPDVILLETMPRADEVGIVLQLISEVAPHIPVWVALSVLESGHLADGTSLGVVTSMLTPQVEAVGVNCLPIQRVEPALAALGEGTDLPLIAYPNSGETYDAVTKTWSQPKRQADGISAGDAQDGTTATSLGEETTTGELLVESLPIWYQRGARVIGGCCRTTPEDISTLAAAAKSYE